MTFNVIGNLQSMRYGNGVTNLYQYDSLNRLTNLVWGTNGSSGPLASFAYQLKAGGTRTNLVESVNSSPSVTCQWAYDSLYRLTNEIRGAASVGYQYDAVGNRLARKSAGTPLLPADHYTYDLNDEVLTNDSGNFGYDYDGGTTGSPNGNSYAYDAVDRMTLFDGVDTIYYDGDGNRVYKQVNRSGMWVSIYYLVDDRNPSGYPQVVEEYQTATNLSGTPVVLSRAYNYGLSLISQQQFNTNTLQPSTLSYYGYDGHGSVRFLTGTNGAITDTYTYDAYGTLISSSGSTPNNYLYSGQQYDPDLGLYYNRARYLNTDLGRFWTMDTHAGNNEDPLSLHKYLYCQDDPVAHTDPTGHDIGDLLAIINIFMNFSAMLTPVDAPASGLALPQKTLTVDVVSMFTSSMPQLTELGAVQYIKDANAIYAQAGITIKEGQFKSWSMDDTANRTGGDTALYLVSRATGFGDVDVAGGSPNWAAIVNGHSQTAATGYFTDEALDSVTKEPVAIQGVASRSGMGNLYPTFFIAMHYAHHNVMAHEIGHILGLDDEDFSGSPADSGQNLMASGALGTVLTKEQITEIRTSPLLH